MTTAEMSVSPLMMAANNSPGFTEVAVPSEGNSFSFNKISYYIKNKEILHDVSGYLEGGTCLAIMGASGAGKSSLMDVLAGRRKTGIVTGEIRVNGQPVPENFHRLAGYVMQDDALIGQLTVYETLQFSHALRMPKHIHLTQAKATIDEIIKVLNLTKVEHSRIGTSLNRGISGGERRRLNIGIELVTSPSILFIDEPTSGLDARNALRVMRAILRLCKTGKTIICTIHQPRSNVFFMFQGLLLLHQGHVIYFGQAKDALDYFGNLGYVCPRFINPADFLLDVIEDGFEGEETYALPTQETIYDDDDDDDDDHNAADSRRANNPQQATDKTPLLSSGPAKPKLRRTGSRVDPTTFAEVFPTTIHGQKLLAWLKQEDENVTVNSRSFDVASVRSMQRISKNDVNQRYPISQWRQLMLLTYRTFLHTVRDPAVMYVRTGAAIGIALLVGAIFFQKPDNSDSSGDRINVMLFLMCVFSLFCLPAIANFIQERALYMREHASGFYSTSSYFLASFLVEFPILLSIVVAYGCICYWMVGLEPTAAAFFFFLLVILLVINVGFALSQLISAAVSSLNLAIAIYMIILVYSLLMGGFIVSASSLPAGMQWMLQTSYFYHGFSALIVNEFENKDYGKEIIQNLKFEEINKFVEVAILTGMFVVLRVAAYLVLRFYQIEKR